MPDLADYTVEDARNVMRERWGYSTFRPGQAEILEAVLEGRDVLGVLPTGGGKSLCYQLPALLGEGMVLVVSPLIALMQDQVEALQDRGIEATFLNSTLPTHEIEQRWTNAEFGQYDLAYMAPERLAADRFEARAERLNISLIAVDEAHCVSEWGHNFRPEYLEIAAARSKLDEPSTLAVTATATPTVRRDILDLLELPNPVEVVRGFDRPNISWSVFRTANKWNRLKAVVDGVPGTGIVYAATRAGTERWRSRLEDQGVDAAAYHGGIGSETREQRQQAWLRDDVRVMVATNAFGMGIDKPDVRFVVHVDLPSSLESYYQEAGRAGRDGRPAYAVLLFQPPDAETQASLIDASHPTAAEIRQVYDAVCSVGQVPVGSEMDGPLVINVDAVLKTTGFSRTKVDTAVELIDRQGAWSVVPRRRYYGLVRFSQAAREVRRYAQTRDNRALAEFVRDLLRVVHADAFGEWWPIDLRLFARQTGLSRERVQRGLRFLEERGLLGWQPPGAALQVELSFPRAEKLPVDNRSVQKARERAEERLDHMLRYARSVTCRRRILLTYFGEACDERCGNCDICLGRHEPAPVTPDDEPLLRQILDRVDAGVPQEQWFERGTVSPPRQAELVDWLFEREYLHLADPLRGTLQLTEKGRQWVESDGATG